MGGPSPEKGRGNRHQLQIDTTKNRRKTAIYQMSILGLLAVNRTAVIITLDSEKTKQQAVQILGMLHYLGDFRHLSRHHDASLLPAP
jgi:hypothetical protein